VLYQPNNKAVHLITTDDLSGVCQVGQPMIITAYAMGITLHYLLQRQQESKKEETDLA